MPTGWKSILIITRKEAMGKSGRKRKTGNREPAGRIQRGTTIQRLNEMNLEHTRAVKAVVLAQPHRKGQDDEWLASEAGRFCRKHGLDRAIKEACDAYLTTERRWAAGYGAPRGFEQFSAGGSGAGPTEAQMKAWVGTLNRIEKALRDMLGHPGYVAVRKLVIEDMEPPANQDPRPLISGVAEIAFVLGMLDRNPHPFRG